MVLKTEVNNAHLGNFGWFNDQTNNLKAKGLLELEG